MKQAVKDANIARERWFKGIADKPKMKRKHITKPSFYVNYESLRRVDGYHFQGEKIGVVETSEVLPKLPKGKKYSNPHISFDGKYWYLSVGYEVTDEIVELSQDSLGIDLGVKDLAIVSNQEKHLETYKNINKSKRVHQLEKRLKREQRRLSRMQEANTKSKVYYKTGERKGQLKQRTYFRPLHECKNWLKQKEKISLIHRQLTNIRNNYVHQTTSEIVKAKPARIVMETLKVKNMLKNKHLAKAIQQQKFYEFKRQIEYKAERFGIEVVSVPWNYPSSKLCHNCGHKKVDLKLSDRTYYCKECGYVEDRDVNASLNLANYSI